MTDTKRDPKWRKFEKAIQAIFSRNPRATITPDAEVVGRSGRKRKLELLVDYPFELPFAEGFQATVPIKIAVDCKDHKEKVGRKKVEEFHGQMDDIGVPVGIMVSSVGFDQGAKARAPQLNIYLVNVPWDLMALAKGLASPPEFYQCAACADARPEGSFRGLVHWGYPESVHDVAWGDCDWCNAPHAICPDCGDITGFCETDLGIWIECSGGCERLYRVTPDPREGDQTYETLSGLQRAILIKVYRKGLLKMDEVAAIVAQSKWQYADDGAHNIASQLHHHGWLAMEEDGLRATEETAEFMQKQLPNARHSYASW